MICKIQIPDNNFPERKYIIDVLFSEFLHIEYKLEVSDIQYYTIRFDNKTIIINDDFFNNFPAELSYLKKENIPQKVIFAENQFSLEANIPILYGNSDIEVSENKIFCGNDIFASSFFMLTRWEEYVIKEKDNYGRFPDKFQLSVKHNFNERPVVNEYMEMLRKMIAYLGIEIENKHKYKPVITHDIDFFARYDKFSKVIKATGGDIIKRKSFKKAFHTINSYIKIKRGKEKDPYDTFDYLMNLSEKVNLKSHFYFIPSLLGEEDAKYDITEDAVIKMMQHIIERGHIVGIHGAFRSYDNEEIYIKELKRFPEKIKINEGRQHLLRNKNPDTWQVYENAGLEYDSTTGFRNYVGFRAGTCYEYSVFNILSRKKLKLKEIPLIIMEQALVKKYSEKESILGKFATLKQLIKKYKGNFVILWHNNNFNIPEWENFKPLYEKIITEIYK